MRCPTCGNPLTPGDAFCGECGRPTGLAFAPQGSVPATPPAPGPAYGAPPPIRVNAPSVFIACLLEAVLPGTGLIYAQRTVAGFIVLAGTFIVFLSGIFWILSLDRLHPLKAGSIALMLLVLAFFWWIARILWAGLAAAGTASELRHAAATSYAPPGYPYRPTGIA